MNLDEYEVMYQVEDHHWWYLGMKAITCRVLEHYLPRDGSALKILDAGCGTGAVMEYLRRYGAVVGIDYSAEALRFSQKRALTRLARASVLEIPFVGNLFDLIVSFDVICEMGVDDERALLEFRRILKPGGLVMLRLPAYAWLRGRHDVATHISHRYTRGEVEAKLKRNGLTPVRLSYANMFLFPIAVAKRLSERLLSPHQTGSDLTLDPGPMNGVLRSILSAEAPLVSGVGLPFGLTVVALARKIELRSHGASR
jgi:SAM-dependent methyltransferase